MQSSHAAAAVSSAFDDPNLIAYGGLEPVVRLAERCGLPALADELIKLPASKDGTGAFPAAKVMSLVGGMVVGADSIDDVDRLRHGAMGRPDCRCAGPVHAAVVSAFLHAWACEATACRGPPVPARTGPSYPAAARRGPGRLRGHPPGHWHRPSGQGTLFDTWCYHAAFTDSPLSLHDTERDHRRPARPACSARRLTLHLPERSPWRTDFTQLFSIAHALPGS